MDFAKLEEGKHEYLKNIFSFPEYYGCNLDALNDCLGDLRATTVITYNGHAAGEFSGKVLTVMENCGKITVTAELT